MPFANLYDGFIFDYGGVLVRHQTPAEQNHMASIAGIADDHFRELYWKDRIDYDKGLITGIEYWQAIGRDAGLLLAMDQISTLVEADSVSWLNFDEPMWDYIQELRTAGKRVAILSNMPKDLGEAIKARTQRFEIFDHVTLSYEIKSVKPEAPIYEDCLAGIGTAAMRTIFFDDRIANVKGAEMVGINGLEFFDRDEILRQVRG